LIKPTSHDSENPTGEGECVENGPCAIYGGAMEIWFAIKTSNEH